MRGMKSSHNSSTTAAQMQDLLERYGERIRTESMTRAEVMRLTGLGESAARRLCALSRGLKTGKRFNTHPAHPEAQDAPDSPEEAGREPAAQIRMDMQGDRLTVDASALSVSDPDALLRAAGVDMTTWEVERVVTSAWQMGSMPRRVGNDQDGWRRDSSEAQVTPLQSVKIYLKRRRDTLCIKEFKADALAEITAAAQPRNLLAPAPKRTRGQLLYIGAHDVHVGKLALSVETLQEYNSGKAAELAMDALTRLLADANHHGIGRIVFPVGHDLAHFESGSYGTSSGTPQDPDGRYRVMRRLAYTLMVDMIELAAQVAPVDVIGVPGNHGRDTDLAIAERLEARFDSHKHIQVQVPLTPRTYYRFGTNLLGLTHGDRVKAATLPLIMADEARRDWAETTHREWMLGHFHAKQVYQVMHAETETRGVRVRVLPSISATDYWHAVSGYSNARAMEAYRYDPENGYAGHHSVTVTS